MDPTRRDVLGWSALATGIVGCAATGGFIVGRYLLPPGEAPRLRRMYVGQVSDIPAGGSLPFLAPTGERFLLTRQDDVLVAFSATCPHLGCKVHWEGDNERFFCPCHHGAFAPDGSPIAGPPKDENTPLRSLPVEVAGDAVYALVPLA